MAMKCAQCGTRLVPGTRSCASCGQQFATEVPPDPIPVQAAAAPPPQTPYGQAPQYGQQPQGQAPFGQNAMGAPGPVGPQDPVKKYAPWAIAAVAAVGLYMHFNQPPPPVQPQPVQPVTQPNQPTPPQSGPTPPADPSQPSQPVQPVSQPTGPAQPSDSNPLVANINLIGQLRGQFIQINGQPQPNDASWKSAMEQNAQQFKAAADQGTQMTWPAQISQGQPLYQTACSNYSYVGGNWPAAIEAGNQAGAQDCVAHFKAGDAAMQQLFALLKSTQGGAGAPSQSAMHSSLGANFQLPALNGSLSYTPKK